MGFCNDVIVGNKNNFLETVKDTEIKNIYFKIISLITYNTFKLFLLLFVLICLVYLLFLSQTYYNWLFLALFDVSDIYCVGIACRLKFIYHLILQLTYNKLFDYVNIFFNDFELSNLSREASFTARVQVYKTSSEINILMFITTYLGILKFRVDTSDNLSVTDKNITVRRVTAVCNERFLFFTNISLGKNENRYYNLYKLRF